MTATASAASIPTAYNASNLDPSLDQLIKHNKSMRRDRQRQRGQGNMCRGGGGGFPRGAYIGPLRNSLMKRGGMYSYRHNAYGGPSKFARQASEDVWQHDMFEKDTKISPPPFAVRSLGIETGTKLYISKLDYNVSTDDIKELFSEVGDVKRCSIHFDLSGRSKGTAEVVYSRKIDGMAALERYNNVQLDGKAMKIEFIGSNLVTPTSMPSSATTTTMAAQSASTLQVSTNKRFYDGHDFIGLQARQAPNHPFGMGSGAQGRRVFGGRSSWGYQGRDRGRGGCGRGRGGRGGRGQGFGFGMGRGASAIATKSAADLDAELEIYHSDVMQT